MFSSSKFFANLKSAIVNQKCSWMLSFVVTGSLHQLLNLSVPQFLILLQLNLRSQSFFFCIAINDISTGYVEQGHTYGFEDVQTIIL